LERDEDDAASGEAHLPMIGRSARLRSLMAGAVLPWEAAKLIFERPTLLLWASLPLLITLVLYYYVIGGLTAMAQALVSGWFITWGLNPQGLVVWSLEIMAGLALALVAAVTFAFTSSVVASPFNDLLARRTERYATPPLPAAGEATAAQQMRVIWIDLFKAVAAGTASLVALLVVWIPVVNLISFASAFALISFQYLSYPQTRRGIGLGGGLLFLWRHAYACAGFGATISFLFAIPFLGSFALPVAVVGGTLLASRCPGGDGFERLR
jgi:uncharacterized protein involved in cysteine biosynthesis